MLAKDTIQERRQHERRPLRVHAAIAFSATQIFEVKTYDIGLGGVGVIADVELKPGAELFVRIPLPAMPDIVIIETRAKVAYSILGNDMEGFRIGLRFLNLDANASSALRQFLK